MQTQGWFARLASSHKYPEVSVTSLSWSVPGHSQHHAVYGCRHSFKRSCSEFNFPAHDERGVCARYCNKQNTISTALIIFLFLWKEAASAVASANMQLFNGFILL